MTARGGRARLLRLAAFATALATGGAALHAQTPASGVQIGISRSAETVTVGDPFRVAVRVRAPLGSTIEFPSGPDSTAAVQSLDPPAPAARQDPAAVDETATYRVAAWDVGTLPIALGELVVRTPAGVRRYTLAADSVFVRSVLPADTTERVPKPVRPIFEAPATPNWLWLLVALAVALLLLLLWWWWRRRRAPAAVAPEDAYAHAQSEFARVERLGLIEAGERGRYVALMIDVMRAYLQSRDPDARRSHTSTELLLALRRRPTVPGERLGAVLAEGDLVKFAGRSITADRARQIGLETRGVVEMVEEAARRAAAAEEAARRAREAAAGKEAA